MTHTLKHPDRRFVLSPQAYLRSSTNVIDFLIVLTSFIEVVPRPETLSPKP